MCLKNQVTRFYEGSGGGVDTSSGLLVPIFGELFYDHYWRTDKTWKCSLFCGKSWHPTKTTFCVTGSTETILLKNKTGARFLENRGGAFFLNAWKSRRAIVVCKKKVTSRTKWNSAVGKKRWRFGLAISLKTSSIELFCEDPRGFLPVFW